MHAYTLRQTTLPLVSIKQFTKNIPEGKWKNLKQKQCSATKYFLPDDGYFYRIELRFGIIFIRYQPKKFLRLTCCSLKDKLIATLKVKYTNNQNDQFAVYFITNKSAKRVIDFSFVWTILFEKTACKTSYCDAEWFSTVRQCFIAALADFVTDVYPWQKTTIEQCLASYKESEIAAKLSTLTKFMFVPCQQELKLTDIPHKKSRMGFLRSVSLKSITRKLLGASGENTVKLLLEFCKFSTPTRGLEILMDLNWPLDHKHEFIRILSQQFESEMPNRPFYLPSSPSKFLVSGLDNILPNYSWLQLKRFIQSISSTLDVQLIVDINTMIATVKRQFAEAPPLSREIKTIEQWHNFLVFITNHMGTQTVFKLWQHPDFIQFDQQHLPEPLFSHYQIRFPKTNLDLKQWGKLLHICIGSYDLSIHQGIRVCFALYNTRTSLPEICIDITFKENKNQWIITQICGKYNQNQTPLLAQTLADLLGIPCHCDTLQAQLRIPYSYTPTTHHHYPYLYKHCRPAKTQRITQDDLHDLTQKALACIR